MLLEVSVVGQLLLLLSAAGFQSGSKLGVLLLGISSEVVLHGSVNFSKLLQQVVLLIVGVSSLDRSVDAVTLSYLFLERLESAEVRQLFNLTLHFIVVDLEGVLLLEGVFCAFAVLPSLESFFLASLALHLSVNKVILLHLQAHLLSEHVAKSALLTTNQLLSDHVLVRFVLLGLGINVSVDIFEVLFTLQFGLSTSTLLPGLELLLHLVKLLRLLFL